MIIAASCLFLPRLCDSAHTLLLTCGSPDAFGCLLSDAAFFVDWIAALRRRLRSGLALVGPGPRLLLRSSFPALFGRQ